MKLGTGLEKDTRKRIYRLYDKKGGELQYESDVIVEFHHAFHNCPIEYEKKMNGYWTVEYLEEDIKEE